MISAKCLNGGTVIHIFTIILAIAIFFALFTRCRYKKMVGVKNPVDHFVDTINNNSEEDHEGVTQTSADLRLKGNATHPGRHPTFFFIFLIPGLSRHLESLVQLISFFLHSAMFVALSSFSPASVISLQHASFHLILDLTRLLSPGVSTNTILLTMCCSFILLTWLYHVSRFFCNFLGRLHHTCCPSNVFILDRIPPCHSTHPSEHPPRI